MRLFIRFLLAWMVLPVILVFIFIFIFLDYLYGFEGSAEDLFLDWLTWATFDLYCR